MADITYNTDSFPALIRTLSRLRSLRPPKAKEAGTSDDLDSDSVPQSPMILLAYKERHTDERRLWDMARTISLELHEIARVPGAGGNPVEIYEGEFSASET